MPGLPIDPIVYLLLNFHCLMGGVAAVIAARKGYRLGLWLGLGLVGGTAALIAAIFLPPKPQKIDP
ncbi:hypothetical protein [Pantanalinema sp. GBBB05]|uniref:hypothetical protein n=1 Tax=Pantanalinema sp. GBBB05 TaxID=2604139 RepID=UPI001D6F19A4|nr:hypothetical protein [Pantanalinema sp. GBBB05]